MRLCALGLGITQSQVVWKAHWRVLMLWYPNYPVRYPVKLALSPNYRSNCLWQPGLQQHRCQSATYCRCGACVVGPAEEYKMSLCQRWSKLSWLAGCGGSLGGHNLAMLGRQVGRTALWKPPISIWYDGYYKEYCFRRCWRMQSRGMLRGYFSQCCLGFGRISSASCRIRPLRQIMQALENAQIWFNESGHHQAEGRRGGWNLNQMEDRPLRCTEDKMVWQSL